MVIEIGNCLVSTEILTGYFCCDYPKCQGCCCIIGDSGAPLEEAEKEALETQFKDYEPFLAPDGKQTIQQNGFSIIDSDGDLVTPLIKGDGRCAYSVTDENGNTFCAIEKGFEKCGGALRKPLSCWIFPIRLKTFSTGSTGLMLSREHLCSAAFKKGGAENIKVYEFLKEPIIHKFGEDFYEQLDQAARLLDENPSDSL
ncbi:MAG: DUF3109 family protein [Bacteroidales bacterium]|nr:DUF3109 family protein [Bacteroidales bacterium]MBP5518396.1 DUF3109 family protein [Bacteroidales bacterium]MBP5693546.1 DUF3109 family protein [Bacteroidales bacterium]